MNTHAQAENYEYGVRLNDLLWAQRRAERAEAENARLMLLVAVQQADLDETRRQRDEARDTAQRWEEECWQARGAQ